MSGEAEYVEFHNKNYGCSGVMPKSSHAQDRSFRKLLSVCSDLKLF